MSQRPSQPERTGSPRVLIVRPSALGDVSRTVPALVTLRRALPQARIDWLVNDSFADVIRHHPDLDGMIPFSRQGYRGGWSSLFPGRWSTLQRWGRQLRRAGYDLAIDLQGLLRSGLFTWLTRAPRRIGFANARELGWLGYTEHHQVDRSMHTVDRMLRLLELAGFEPVADMRLYVGESDVVWLDQRLAEHGWQGQPYAVLAPTAQWRCKCWPLDRYAAIARRLLDSGIAGRRIIVLAAPHERDYIRPLFEACGEQVMAPVTTVGQMMAVLSRATLLVCNDSAPLHIAVGLARPIVTIFGPTDPGLVGPYQRMASVVRPPGLDAAKVRLAYRRHRDDQSLIAQVSAEAVWAKIEEQLG